MRFVSLALLLFASAAFCADPIKGEKTVGNEILVPDVDGSVYHVPAKDKALLDAVRAKVAGHKAKPMPAKASAPQATGSALDVLNAQRAARGLSPYIEDPQLTAAAEACAAYRAKNCIAGHCQDFAFLAKGVIAKCAGCAAWPLNLGFGACEAYSTQHTYCGAAWVVGKDGVRYCHAFYR